LVFRVSPNKSLECDSLYDSNHKIYDFEMRLYVVGLILLSFSLGCNTFNPQYASYGSCDLLLAATQREEDLRLARDTRERKDARQNTLATHAIRKSARLARDTRERKDARHTRWTVTAPGNSRDSRRRATHSRLRIAHTRSRSTRSLQELAIGSTGETTSATVSFVSRSDTMLISK
jgi:hypothetical protein